jgi:hypothetical protein
MTPKDFIIKSINDLVLEFPNTRARYENHQLSNTHFVEIVPNEVYSFDEDYQKREEEIVFQFIEKFPTQNLCFITDDAVVGLDKVEYETKGNLYDLIYSVNLENCHVVEITNVHTACHEQAYSKIFIEQRLAVVSEITVLSYNVAKISFIDANGIASNNTSNNTFLEKAGETNYAVAA